MADNCN
jgi:hypothetical protein